MKYTIDNVRVLSSKGPWTTKSDAELMVKFAMPSEEVKDFFQYNQKELDKIPEDIRGLRGYTVRGLRKGTTGGKEFHRVRKELVFGLEGRIEWICEDVFGGEKILELTPKNGVYVPPFIIHTYNTLEDNSSFLVIANTLFNPDKRHTHDTYSREDFEALQKKYNSVIC